jgi:CRP-like cAMP-binding protein
VNVGRRVARERIAHLLCEFAKRLEIAGLGATSGYQLSMTQEQLGDATGLTSDPHLDQAAQLVRLPSVDIR